MQFHSWFSPAQVDRVLHAALDKYAFFAVTGSLDTLKQLIGMLEKDNERRQVVFDITGFDPVWMIDVSAIVYSVGYQMPCSLLQFQDSAIANPQYEFVAWAYASWWQGTCHVQSRRQWSGVICPWARPHPTRITRKPHRSLLPPIFLWLTAANLNPFLVILNAEIKFRRYLRQQRPPPLPLPTNVMTLIHLTIELVKLIYWWKGSRCPEQVASSREHGRLILVYSTCLWNLHQQGHVTGRSCPTIPSGPFL